VAYLGDVGDHVLAKGGNGGAGPDTGDEQRDEEEEGRRWHCNPWGRRIRDAPVQETAAELFIKRPAI
jgi:hypothetical protein